MRASGPSWASARAARTRMRGPRARRASEGRGMAGIEVRSQTMDVERVRLDFPILERGSHGKPLVYLDSAATSQKPRAVIEALTDYYERHNANIHRGVYELAEEATSMFEAARGRLAAFI